MTQTSIDPVARARAEADAARADLVATLGELQTRLNPRGIARGAIDAARDRGEDLAERGVEFARARPAATAGLAAGALLLLVRKPLARLFSRRHATAADDRDLDTQFRPTPARLPEKDRA